MVTITNNYSRSSAYGSTPFLRVIPPITNDPLEGAGFTCLFMDGRGVLGFVSMPLTEDDL